MRTRVLGSDGKHVVCEQAIKLSGEMKESTPDTATSSLRENYTIYTEYRTRY